MDNEWQLQEAKNRFSEVVDSACKKGPQTVTRRGKPAVVILSVPQYEKLLRGPSDLVQFFRQSPLRGVDLAIEREQDTGRDIKL